MGRYTGRKCSLLVMFALTAAFFFVELVTGHITNSMALVADSFHMLSDIAALAIAFLSVEMSPKKWSKNTFGWARAEVLGALVNAVFLVALCFSILVEALKRLYEIETIHNPQIMLYVGVGGLVVNLIGLVLFHKHGMSHGHGHSHGGGVGGGGGGDHGHSHSHSSDCMTTVGGIAVNNDNDNDDDDDDGDECDAVSRMHPSRLQKSISNGDIPNGHVDAPRVNLNMRGVFLHVLADALGSVIVVCSALVIWLTEWQYKFYVDPFLSILMVMLIMRSTYPLLVESALILLQTVPTHIKVDAIQKKLLTEIDGILTVHEFHVWQLAGDRIIASAHIRCRNLTDYMRIAERVKEFFHNEGIHSTTIQPEFVEVNEECERDLKFGETDCVLDCPPDKKCAASTCCGLKKEGKESPNLSDPLGDNTCRQRTNASAAGGDMSSAYILDGDVSSSDLPRVMESGNLLQSNRAV